MGDHYLYLSLSKMEYFNYLVAMCRHTEASLRELTNLQE